MPEYFKRDPAGVPQEITNRIAQRILDLDKEKPDGPTAPWNLRQLAADHSGDPAGGSGDTGGEVPVMSDEWLAAMRREYKEEDPPPPRVIRAMSKIAIYAATYGKDQTGAFLRDTTIAEPLAVVREWLKEYGFSF